MKQEGLTRTRFYAILFASSSTGEWPWIELWAGMGNFFHKEKILSGLIQSYSVSLAWNYSQGRK